MAVTPLLHLPETSNTMVQWHQPINDALRKIECWSQDVKVLDFTSGDVSLLSSEQISYFVFYCKNVNGNRVLTLSDIVDALTSARRFLAVVSDENNVGNITITVNNGTDQFVLRPGAGVLLYVMGSSLFVLGTFGNAVPSPSNSYEVNVFIAGLPPANKEVYRLPIMQNVTFEDDFAGSYASARVNPTSPATFTIKKNGSDVGTVTFNPSGAHTFQTTGTIVACAPGDVLTIVSPVVQDATLEDVAIGLLGTKV